MDLSVVFLGTGGSVPTARRATACLLARVGGERLLFDCGEGSQRQMQRSTGLVQVDEIYLTHYHADHYLGLPGLLKTYDLQGRERPLRIVGPPGLEGSVRVRSAGSSAGSPTRSSWWSSTRARRFATTATRCAASRSSTGCAPTATRWSRTSGRGASTPSAAARLGVEPGPDFGRLQAGEAVRGADGAVRPEQVMGEPRRGRKVVITGDTAPCEMTRLAAHEAELLVHDGSFADEELERAAETGHSTARQAAELAREAGVKLLALVHVSSRYDVRDVLAEAREAFPAAEAPRDFDLVEIPFPERGEPRLIENGAAPGAGLTAIQASAQRRGEVGDRLGDRDRLVLLEEVLGGQQDRVVAPRAPPGPAAAGRAPAPGRARPRRSAPGRAARPGPPRGSAASPRSARSRA